MLPWARALQSLTLMVFIVVPNLQALRHWLLRLDARLVTSDLQSRWLEREKQAEVERQEVDVAMGELRTVGSVRALGGEA